MSDTSTEFCDRLAHDCELGRKALGSTFQSGQAILDDCAKTLRSLAAERDALRTHQDYDLEMLNSLLDYIERVEKTEHGMDGAVREIARRAAALRGPTFRSVRILAAIDPAPVSVREAARVLCGSAETPFLEPASAITKELRNCGYLVPVRIIHKALRAFAEGKE